MSVEQELAELRATVRLLKDRQDILDVIVRESRGRDRHDTQLTASCYWPDGADEHGPVPFPATDYPEIANKGHTAAFAMNQHNLTQLHSLIQDAILRYEPRILLEDVQFDTQGALGGELRITLVYLIRQTNTRSNMVFPFYFAEGSNVRRIDR